VRRAIVADGDIAPWFHGCALGRSWAGDDVMGDDFWCRHLVATRGILERRGVAARERLRIATRGMVVEGICEVGGRRRVGGKGWMLQEAMLNVRAKIWGTSAI
jgi:hypothetical protein